MEHYRQIAIFPWQADASFGNKIEPASKREVLGEGAPSAVPGIDYEGASDPEDERCNVASADGLGSDIIAMVPPWLHWYWSYPSSGGPFSTKRLSLCYCR